MSAHLIIHASVIYCNGSPVARFGSTLQACRELTACGYHLSKRLGARLLFKQLSA